MRLSVVVPMYNEVRALAKLVDTISVRFPADSTEFILVDDGSTDGTAAIAENMCRGKDNISVLSLPTNVGKGAALRAGVAMSNGEALLFMDADLSTSLDSFEEMLTLLDQFDIVIGSRSVDGSVVLRSSLLRALMGRTFNSLMRLITGLQIQDSQCGFKLFRGDVGRLLFSMSAVDRFSIDPEVLRIGQILGYSINEFPVKWTAGNHSAVRPVRDSLESAASLIATRLATRPRRVLTSAQTIGLPIPSPVQSIIKPAS